jgi:acyl-CoA reductase-like NAD-dependent aldehyde dehydrogenase
MQTATSTIVTINPTTEEVLERIDRMDHAAIEHKLARATAAAKSWGSASLSERAAVLRTVAAALRAQREALAAVAVDEMGKPIVQARAEIDKCAWALEYFAEHASAMLSAIETPSTATRSYVAFRPIGIILAVMPWNFPYWQVVRAAAPALMAGNTMLLRHAENTTRCGLEIERVFAQAAPEGVFGTLLVTHEEVAYLIRDPRIAAVTLTGSEHAGMAVATAAGEALKKCVLELGGSDAFVVLADADLAKAAQAAVTARFQNNGQSCIAAKRFIVVEPVYEEFLNRFVEAAKAQRVGNPRDEETALGPCARNDLREALDDQVQETLENGAERALGASPIAGTGYFYEPTIVGDVKPGMAMFDEEVFGPAAAVVRASDAQHAIALANHSRYGLGASLWTRDSKAAEELAAGVEAGSVFINGMVASDPRLPFGGLKKSGYGRELSTFGIHEFVNIQTVWIGPAREAAVSSE